MNILTVILSWQGNKHLWPGLLNKGIDNLIILCGGCETESHMEGKILYLNCSDKYEGLPEKMICAVEFILNFPEFSSITHILKIDDSEGLFTKETIDKLYITHSKILEHNYIGQSVCFSGKVTPYYHQNKVSDTSIWKNKLYLINYNSTYARGGQTYILSRYAMTCINNAFNSKNLNIMRTLFIFEDDMIGFILKTNGISPIQYNYGIKFTEVSAVITKNIPKEGIELVVTLDDYIPKGWKHIADEFHTIKLPVGSRVRFGLLYYWIEKTTKEESFQATVEYFGYDTFIGRKKIVLVFTG
jgi:hypothetical protein